MESTRTFGVHPSDSLVLLTLHSFPLPTHVVMYSIVACNPSLSGSTVDTKVSPKKRSIRAWVRLESLELLSEDTVPTKQLCDRIVVAVAAESKNLVFGHYQSGISCTTLLK